MSAYTVRAGQTIVFDPSDKRVVTFDWDAETGLPDGVQLSASAWTITAIQQSGVTALTNDNAAFSAADRTTSTRLLATTATVGDSYWVSNKITTDESPAQEIEQRFKVKVENQ
jgi:hypothetical protein